MHIATSARHSLALIPNELINDIVTHLPTRDVANVAQTCRKLYDFTHDTQFVARYVQHHLPAASAALPPPEGVVRKPWLEQYAGWDGECCRSLQHPIPWHVQNPEDDTFAALRAVKASERVGATPRPMEQLKRGVYHPLYKTTPPNSLYGKPTRAVNWGATTEMVLEGSLGYAKTLARFAFPPLSDGADPHRFERFYKVDNSLVALCTAGNQTWVYRIGPASRSECSAYRLEPTSGWAGDCVTQTLTAEPLRQLDLTRWGMAPIIWDKKIQSILVWGERAPRLLSCGSD